jgi:V8-like Glu-specific endopeptidase
MNKTIDKYCYTLLTLALLFVISACTSTKPQPSTDKVPPGLAQLPFLQDGWSKQHDGAKPGKFKEVKRAKLKGIETEELNMLPETKDVDDKVEDLRDEKAREIGELKGEVAFEFFDLASKRFFFYTVDRTELAKASRSVAKLVDENLTEAKPVDRKDMEREDDINKSWSNSTDNRIRRAIADGFSDTHSIYQSLADYGGCSATVLSASSSRMVAITAAHCIFTGSNFSTSKLRPRRNGSTSPTWGSWTAYAFGYYPAYLNNDCENNWDGGDCIKHDIALVIASSDSGATPPRGMGWGYRPKSFLDDHTKYRRGYPGCDYSHSPSSCTTNNLYGDGALSVGSFSKLDADGWNRQIRFSSDINPGDSGSGLYYYRDGNPYVFAVTSAEPSDCKTNCTSSRPNYGRRITPQFYDFINSVIF